MNNKKFISFLPYILVLGIMLLLISYGSEGNTKNFNYNEFMTKANTMTFTKAETEGQPDSAVGRGHGFPGH